MTNIDVAIETNGGLTAKHCANDAVESVCKKAVTKKKTEF